MSGRPREFDEATVLDRAVDAFWATGYDGTSLNDLVDIAGVKKGSLYAAFGDKRQLYLKALAHYLHGLIVSTEGALSGPGDPRGRLGSFLESSARRVASGDRRGCFLCTASTDAAVTDPEVGQLVRQGLARLERVFVVALAAIVPAPRRVAAGRQLLALYLGIQALARAGYPAESILAIIEESMRAY
jgi:AcrR family transcriptional regulator